jgi:hypothetical protein
VISIAANGLGWIDAPSAGRTSVPVSSIQTAIGTFEMPRSSSMR